MLLDIVVERSMKLDAMFFNVSSYFGSVGLSVTFFNALVSDRPSLGLRMKLFVFSSKEIL